MTESKRIDEATGYLMTILLQRLETSNPGLIQELLDGVHADRNAIAATDDMTPEVEETFTTAFSILEHARR